MKKKEKKVPQLRFPEFAGDWEQRKLGEITTEKLSNGIMNHPSEEMTGVKHINVINMYTSDRIHIEDLTDSEYDDDAVKKCNVEIGDIFLTRSSVKPEGIAEANVLLDSGQYVYDDHLIRMKIDKCKYDAFFVKICLGTPLIKKQFIMKSKTTAFTTIGQDDIASCDCVFPSYGEQKAIGAFFDDLDHLITLYQRKLEKIKELKKGMLQKMFPKNGKKVPEIRFKGFIDDWEQRKFSDCYKMSSGYAFKMRDYCDSGIGLINGESIQHGIINDDNLNYLPESFIQQYPDFILKEGDIVVGLNRPITNGNLKIARIPNKYNDSLLYQRAGKIVYKGNCDKDFTYILLSKEILKYTLVEAVGSDQPFISTSKLDKWQMMIPSDIEEQKKIGDYFRNLDYLITLHQCKIDKFKELKKGLLQQMFV